MELIKIKDVRTGAIKEVKKTLASDYIGTGNFVIAKEEKNIEIKPNKSTDKKEEK